MVVNRMCTVCRERREKRDLIRVVKAPDGSIAIDEKGNMPGRGAYICKTGECRANAKKRRVLERAFSCSVSSEIYDLISKTGDE